MTHKVILPYDPVWQALTWALDNCSSYITNKATVDGQIVYYFKDEKDVLMFKLRWG